MFASYFFHTILYKPIFSFVKLAACRLKLEACAGTGLMPKGGPSPATQTGPAGLCNPFADSILSPGRVLSLIPGLFQTTSCGALARIVRLNNSRRIDQGSGATPARLR